MGRHPGTPTYSFFSLLGAVFPFQIAIVEFFRTHGTKLFVLEIPALKSNVRLK